jgi:transposase-like protein
MSPSADPRAVRGHQIAQLKGAVRRIDANSYKVESQSGNWDYDVISGELGWICSCPDAKFNGVKCKHVWAVEFSFALHQKVEQSVTLIQPVNAQACPACQSGKVVKHGIRHNDCGDIQQFLCKDCGRAFVVNLGFERMRATPQTITSAMQLYFSGESLRSVQKFLRLQGANVSHVTVYKWIGRYVKLMEKYLSQIIPQLSETWRADEIFVKFKGNMKYVFALMDDQTRFWIAQQVCDGKFTADVRPLFAEGKKVAGKKPAILITDGGMHFTKPFKQEFYTARYPRTRHVRDIRFGGEVHNNKMERMNGEIRDREKVMRGLKKTNTPILKGYQIYHNFVRPHESLDGDTPAERAGIRVDGENKWLTLIQNAAKKQ